MSREAIDLEPYSDRSPEDYEKAVLDRGYEIAGRTSLNSWGFWVYEGVSGQRLIDARRILKEMEKPDNFGGRFPAVHDDNYWGTKFKYNTHGQKAQDCIPDYADREGRKHWKDYVVVRDKSGNIVREGPKPFRSAAERKAYEKMTGQRHRDPTEKDHRS